MHSAGRPVANAKRAAGRTYTELSAIDFEVSVDRKERAHATDSTTLTVPANCATNATRMVNVSWRVWRALSS